MKSRKVNKAFAYLKFFILILILVGIPAYIWFFQRDFLMEFSNLEHIENYLKAHEKTSAIIYLSAQALQIIICFIPGQWLQIAAAYFYGIWVGILFSIIGAVIGSTIAYFLAVILGRDAIHIIFGEEKVSKMVEWMNTKKAAVLLFIIFLLPGVPKDVTAYIAGISDFKLKNFLIISTAGRIPAMFGSLIIGRAIATHNYGLAIGIGVLALILFALGIIYRKKIDAFIDQFYQEANEEEDHDKISR